MEVQTRIGGFFRRAARLAVVSSLQSAEEVLIGGQAVIEGVMMRSPHSFAVAVRRPGGTLGVIQDFLDRPGDKHPWLKLPVLRGLGTLGQAMTLGIRALRYSAEAALEEPAGPETARSTATRDGTDGAAGGQAPEAERTGEKSKISPWIMTVNLIFSIGFFIFFYKFVPLYLTTVLARHFAIVRRLIIFNCIDGTVRILLFLGFLALLAQWKEIRRLFEYHGAEHKVVWAYEKAGTVDLATARGCTRFHPRCGTSFLLVVMVIAMILYMLLPFQSFLGKLLGRIVLLPLVAGVSFEFIRFAARAKGALWQQASQPGLWLQRITTREPDDGQLETAIKALESAMEMERVRGGELVVA